METKHKILVLDCDHKNALAIVRHLGKTNRYEIHGTSHSKVSIAFFSRFLSKKFVVPSPKSDPSGYLNALLKILDTHEYLSVIPVSYLSYQICAAHKARIAEKTKIIIAGPEQMEIARNKVLTYQAAEKAGVQCPKTITLNQVEDIRGLEISFPCVIKAPLEVGKNIVDYAHNKDELVEKYRKMCKKHSFGQYLPIVQEYVSGHGAGFFALYKKGKCVSHFMHRRIREYPPSGGVSTCAESSYNEDVYKSGKKILDYLNWEGAAMVEFKLDENTNQFKLLEINAKLWGSLELAIVSGANFPQYMVDCALDKDPDDQPYHKERFQWILNGDLLHVFERPSSLFAFLKDLFIAKNDFYLSDIGPNIYQLLFIPVHYYKKWFK